jgi:hypothetical protein
MAAMLGQFTAKILVRTPAPRSLTFVPGRLGCSPYLHVDTERPSEMTLSVSQTESNRFGSQTFSHGDLAKLVFLDCWTL